MRNYPLVIFFAAGPMGQFASKAFDGDPYIEIMRVLPDKELVWWIQKVIWVAEGFTLLEHMGRTYPKLFVYKCQSCNGAGTKTCPHCHGFKIKKATSHNGFRLSEETTVGRLLSTAGTQECDQCGGYCQWDDESEWQGMWQDWEKKLAYYDRSKAKIFDNWYEDVVNEGNLDDDTPEGEDPEFDPSVKGYLPDMDRDYRKIPKRTKALMKRFGGHPYENYDMIPKWIIDPTASLEENADRMALDYNWLPPELDPMVFPEHLLNANNPIMQFQHQIHMEYLIMSNLDAAIKNEPKPTMFTPSAGTVVCPDCSGKPTHVRFAPNWATIFRLEPPFWLQTLSRMNQLGTDELVATAKQRGGRFLGTHMENLQYMERQTSAAGASSNNSSSNLFEVPNQPRKDKEIQAALSSTGDLWQYKLRPGVDAHYDYGPGDPLAYSTGRVDKDTIAVPKVNPLSGSEPKNAQLIYENMNPAKNLARRLRDLRQLGEDATPEERAAALSWLQARDGVGST
ncbi:hypothetical protein CEUSTIGMA_g7373.t1 [Chlamydomonas eustigma]|uniref:Uncharacterized protein n=1 Tax=Chlamydomonas eustigma TaxID=1157962 RepID=A0A250X9Z1_9CHLO|nr:hypothetical protein CEUSTIGMA_g7373.t1 [Chlamydomonas eustigma]|eukprot:GAX79933.1 hypothetical protein CEUSTIGMA_g7373.t1 [Chlamydomonas eustigma]